MADIRNDVPPTSGSGGMPQSPGMFGGLRDVYNALLNIGRQLSALNSIISNSFVSLSGNNTFTGINTFQSGIRYNVRVVTAAGAATVASSDYIVGIKKSVGAAT